MYGLPQVGLLAHELLADCLQKHAHKAKQSLACENMQPDQSHLA